MNRTAQIMLGLTLALVALGSTVAFIKSRQTETETDQSSMLVVSVASSQNTNIGKDQDAMIRKGAIDSKNIHESVIDLLQRRYPALGDGAVECSAGSCELVLQARPKLGQYEQSQLPDSKGIGVRSVMKAGGLAPVGEISIVATGDFVQFRQKFIR